MKRLFSWALVGLILLSSVALLELLPSDLFSELDASLTEMVNEHPWMQFLAVAEVESLDEALRLDEREDWTHPRFSYGKTAELYSYTSELYPDEVVYCYVTELYDSDSGETTLVYVQLQRENAHAAEGLELNLPDGRTAVSITEAVPQYYRGNLFYPSQPDFPGIEVEGQGSYVKLAVFRILMDILAAISLLLLLSADWELLRADQDRYGSVQGGSIFRILLGVLFHGALALLNGVVFLGVALIGVICLCVRIALARDDLHFEVRKSMRSLDAKELKELKLTLQKRYLYACRHWFRTLFFYGFAALCVIVFVQSGFTAIQLYLFGGLWIAVLLMQAVIIGFKGTVWDFLHCKGAPVLWCAPALLAAFGLSWGAAAEEPIPLYVTTVLALFLPGLLGFFDFRDIMPRESEKETKPAGTPEKAKPAAPTSQPKPKQAAAANTANTQSAAAPEGQTLRSLAEEPVKPAAKKPKHSLFAHSGLTWFEARRINREHYKEFHRR